VRRTKADALITRDKILDSAGALFLSQGVSRTTLAHIAERAGVTRGAIYWHFEDKAALFNAMMERARTPLESAMRLLDEPCSRDPLAALQEYARLVFDLTVNDPDARCVFEIATLKTEYVDDMSSVRERRAQAALRWMAAAESRVALAVARGQARPDVEPRTVALGLWALIDGLVRSWMLAPDSFELVAVGGRTVGTHLDAVRACRPGEQGRGRGAARAAPARCRVEHEC